MTEETQRLFEQLHSPCYGCVFAEWEEQNQTGCELGLLDIYKDKSRLVEAYHGDSEFFVVTGGLCKGRADSNSKFNRLSKEERVKAMREWIRTKIDVLVVIMKEYSEWELQKTLGSLKDQSYLPQDVFVINAVAKHAEYVKSTQMVAKHAEGLNWMATYPQKIDEVPFTEGFVIDESVRKMGKEKKKRTDYYVVIKPGQTLQSDFLARVRDEVDEKLNNFVLIDCETPVVKVKAHQHPYVGGNSPMDFEDGEGSLENVYEKLEYFAKEQQNEDMILHW